MTDYVLVERRADGILLMWSEDYERQLWTLVRLRKPVQCVRCNDGLAKGASAFSPITNGQNRMKRLCLRCVSAMARALKEKR